MQNALIPILITVSILIILFCLYRKKSCEESNENKENNENKDNNKNTVFDIMGLLIIAIIMPTIVWYGKYLLDGDAVFRRPYESGWLSFFGSYLGGLLGGIATLIAVVKTIQSNKEEQEHKEKIDKQKENQEAAFIMYYDCNCSEPLV